ncbi:hypothetical protein CFC21_083762 [Triticum aestivum]|uniref:Uncharacterized protein n=3 Tax=Triticum TaxID=4564 RepID=A0A9R1IA68_WHEAT|nr:hypothetical protein CFC21_004196 [Triticum aestivum]KAF7079545.1 hypothetical protein CFC21_083758 [Triticum aestivum]KAF7079547.1 hypothetical protein CFC21_083762 [Triticum aestivum]VAI47359.1 unnamed protein product [Triticum turgidum subsp. durum]
MEEGWLGTVALCYLLGGMISTAAPMLAVSIVAGVIPGQMTAAGMYAAVVTTTNAIATELVTAYAAKKVAGANEDKFGPVKKAAAAAVANILGSAVTIMAVTRSPSPASSSSSSSPWATPLRSSMDGLRLLELSACCASA